MYKHSVDSFINVQYLIGVLLFVSPPIYSKESRRRHTMRYLYSANYALNIQFCAGISRIKALLHRVATRQVYSVDDLRARLQRGRATRRVCQRQIFAAREVLHIPNMAVYIEYVCLCARVSSCLRIFTRGILRPIRWFGAIKSRIKSCATNYSERDSEEKNIPMRDFSFSFLCAEFTSLRYTLSADTRSYCSLDVLFVDSQTLGDKPFVSPPKSKPHTLVVRAYRAGKVFYSRYSHFHFGVIALLPIWQYLYTTRPINYQLYAVSKTIFDTQPVNVVNVSVSFWIGMYIQWYTPANEQKKMRYFQGIQLLRIKLLHQIASKMSLNILLLVKYAV